MWYAEKFENGDWHSKWSPKGPWVLFTRPQLLAKIAELQKQLPR